MFSFGNCHKKTGRLNHLIGMSEVLLKVYRRETDVDKARVLYEEIQEVKKELELLINPKAACKHDHGFIKDDYTT